MQKIKISKLLLTKIILTLLFTFQQGLYAQTWVTNSVIGSGGTYIGYANNRITGTVRQTIIGTTRNSSNINKAGFLYQSINLSTNVESI